MASNATISVNKETVKQFLESGKANPFLIPEYQRPYAWGEDEATTLFDDIKEFASAEAEREASEGTSFKPGTYFLGSIVSYLNDADEREVIDGQQRLTSLMLLLRAIYTKLQSAPERNGTTENFIKQIESCLWRADKYTGEVNYSETFIKSDAMDDDYNLRLQLILETGQTDPDWTDNYSANYRLFQGLYDGLSSDNALFVYDFIICLLDRAIVLPIQADTQDTALTIFATLNDRGLPLSDADIFKAKIYGSLKGEAQKAFIDDWKEIESDALDIGENMQHLFYIYMFYQRALDGDVKTTTPGARKYFEQDKYAKIRNPDVLKHVREILTLQTVARQKNEVEGEAWSANSDILKVFDMFSSYPNEWWQYAVAVFYMAHKEEDGFEWAFLLFLRKLYAEMLRVYIGYPTVNSIKGGIMKLNVACMSSMHPDFDFRRFDATDEAFKYGVVRPHNKHTRRMILSALAYDENGQGKLLPEKWEIEHIFPQHWQANYDLKGYTPEKLSETIEEIGNLMPLEKPLNIGASDGYFEKKREKYDESEIDMAKQMAKRSNWTVDDIHERNIRITDGLRDLFRRWNDEYEASKQIGVHHEYGD